MDALIVLLTWALTLAAIDAKVTEWFKTWLAESDVQFDNGWTEQLRKRVVLGFALASGVVIAELAHLNLVAAFALVIPALPVPPEQIGIIGSGLALAFPADGLRALLEMVKAARDSKQAQATAIDAVTPDSMADKEKDAMLHG